jgi:hypothetical protein
MDIKVIKLVSGEELIASVNENLSGQISYVKPRVFVMQHNQSGQVQAALVPYIMSAPDETIEINASAIVSIVSSVSKQLEDAYLQHTSSIDLTAAKL